ncbi:WXG100 family type VII secretion target [Xylocopilactobacillus apicola]|uniref:WXG100 family type VII secretion target n=1 Tax=Xylocopilactobacillus apicola TaxID=2932184 RepID=A0AAU9DTK1_9LACO|nr:WXG100 family type VII secretion target [Xylocopilactobacillus apicola]BDR59464.1 hypothetical protein XA3_19050 [Xylocopilactobacillus apicola]
MGKHDFEISSLEREIAALQQAKALMEVGGQDLNSVNGEIQNVVSSIDNKEWRGQRRNEFNQKFDNYNREFGNLRNRNNTNIQAVNQKIAELRDRIAMLRSDNSD